MCKPLKNENGQIPVVNLRWYKPLTNCLYFFITMKKYIVIISTRVVFYN